MPSASIWGTPFMAMSQPKGTEAAMMKTNTPQVLNVPRAHSHMRLRFRSLVISPGWWRKAL